MRPRSSWTGLAAAVLVSACQSAPAVVTPASAKAPEGCTVDFPAGAPRLDLAETRAPAQLEQGKSRPYQFASSIPVHRDLVGLGQWTDFSDGWSSLYLRIASPGAKSISLHLAQVQLPARSQVWLCSSDAKVRQGPYREANGGELWTPVVPGSEARLEVQVPTAAKPELRAQLAEVFGAFR